MNTIKRNPWDLDKHEDWRLFLEQKAERLRRKKAKIAKRGNRKLKERRLT